MIRYAHLRDLLLAAVGVVVMTWSALSNPPGIDGVLQEESRDVERSASGDILHRRLPMDDDGTGGSIFQYDPFSDVPSLPSEMKRDGNSHPMPDLSATPGEDEAVFTDQGFVPADDRSDTDAETAGMAPAERSESGQPSEDDQVPGLTDPTEDAADEVGAPVLDPRAVMGNRAAPDRRTGKEGRLDYHAVFDPSIVPFKRNRALNKIDANYELSLASGHLQELQPQGISDVPHRESFWGSLLLQGKAGELLPLPSIAPDSRILRAEVVPKMAVTLLKDEGDNFYIRPSKGGRFRLVFVMDAPSSYFGRKLPGPEVAISDIPQQRLPSIPAKVARVGRRFAAELGLTVRSPYTETLQKLVTYFRSFAPGEPPPPTADIFVDLARGKAGICRHRSFAFVITARSLGIPARYVFNEAHVFVEVFVPGTRPGWMRIDLGGGAESLHIHSGQDKLKHQPTMRDPFNRPTAEGATNVRQLAGADTVFGSPPEHRAPPGQAPDSDRVSPKPPTELRGVAPPLPVSLPNARPTVTTLRIQTSHAFRGEATTARGDVRTGDGKPVKQGVVQLILADSKTRQPIRLLATAALDSRGQFAMTFIYPEDQAPGPYEVQAQFLGSGTHNHSTSP